MSETNSFKKLEEEQIDEFLNKRPGVPPQIEMGVAGNMRTIGFMGDILELYLPRVVDLVISLVGGNRGSQESDFTAGNQKPD